MSMSMKEIFWGVLVQKFVEASKPLVTLVTIVTDPKGGTNKVVEYFGAGCQKCQDICRS